MDDRILFEILEVGTRAVSMCNVQPWRFRWQDGVLEIFMLRIKNFFLKLEGNTWVELGALLENISVAAAAKGFKLEYELFERYGLDQPAAKVCFVPAQAQSVDLESVMRRCTNRRAYRPNPVPQAILEQLGKLNTDPNIKVNMLTGSKKNQFADILVNLEDVRLGNRLLVEEVFPYIRVTKSEVETHCDRLDIKTLELSPLAENCLTVAKVYPKVYSFLYGLFLLFGRKAQRKKFKKELTQGGSLIVLSMIRRDQSSYVSLGQLLQKILNYLTAQHVASYTMVSGLYLLDLLRENLEIYSEVEQLRLLRHQYDLQSFFQFTDQRIALVIRVGYADEPRYRSLRKSVASLMIH